jgi:hypothetical protein
MWEEGILNLVYYRDGGQNVTSRVMVLILKRCDAGHVDCMVTQQCNTQLVKVTHPWTRIPYKLNYLHSVHPVVPALNVVHIQHTHTQTKKKNKGY